ncbi:MAG: ATP-binding protein [Spirochaetia bacterium]|nr:ATP-binding protein [Spirochaetia bacterium]
MSDSDERKKLFPYAKIECARFKGTETKIFLDQITVDGPVHAGIETCMAFIKRNIALGSKIGEVYREDRWEYPLEAVREALINAVIHRDYSILGSDIKIAIFDDMLEITSPGPLPNNLPLSALGTGRSEIRNRTLAPVFKDLKLIEAWGTGIQKMQAETAKYPEINLVMKETGNAFQVEFKKEVTTEVTTEVAWLKVISGEMSRAQIMAAINLKNDEHFRKAYLIPAIENGLIEMTNPEKPTSRMQKYRLTDKGRKLVKGKA